MTIYQYQGQHYDLPEGISKEEALSKIKKHLGEGTEDSGLYGKAVAFGREGVKAAGGLSTGLKKMVNFGGWLDDNISKQEQKLQQFLKETKPYAEENPITSIVGGLTSAVPLMGLTATGNPGAIAGLSGLGISQSEGFQQENLSTNPNIDKDANEKAGFVAGLAGSAGGFIPILGKSLASKIGTGIAGNVGLGLGERALENKILEDYPEVQQDVTNPLAMGADALLGGVGGVIYHKYGQPPQQGKNLTPEDLRNFAGEDAGNDPYTPKNKNFMSDLEDRYKSNLESEYGGAKRRIDQIDKRLERVNPKDEDVVAVLQRERETQQNILDRAKEKLGYEPDTQVKPIISGNALAEKQVVPTIPRSANTMDIKTVKENQLNVQKDIGTGFEGSVFNNPVKAIWNGIRSVVNGITQHNFGFKAKGSIYFDQPVIKFMADVVNETDARRRQLYHMLMDGIPDKQAFLDQPFGHRLDRLQDEKSPRVMIQKAHDTDIHAVLKVFESGYNKYDYNTNLEVNGSHLTPFQKELYKTLSTLWRRLYNASVANAKALGKKRLIPDVPGWYPSVRRGNYSVIVRKPGLSLVDTIDAETGTLKTSDIIYYESFKTEAQAKEFIDFLNKNKGDDTINAQLQDMSMITKDQSFLLDMYLEEVQNAFQLNRAVSKEQISQVMTDIYNKFVERGGTLGAHHKLRTNVPGYAGSDIFQSPAQAGKAFKEAILSSVEDYTRLMMKMEVGTKRDLVVHDPDISVKYPKATNAANFIAEYALNNVDPIDIKIDNAATSWVAEGWYKFRKRDMKIPVHRKALGVLTHLLYAKTLTGRAAFWVGNMAQPIWAIRTPLREDPAHTMQTLGLSMKHLTEFSGFGAKHTNPEIQNFLFWGTQNRPDSFSPQFVNDVDSFFRETAKLKESKGEWIAKFLLGEKPAGWADSFSRLWTSLWMYEVYKNKGFKGTELYKKAIDATDANMARYERQFKAPIFQELGVTGQMLSPMLTFSNNMLGNTIADVRYMIKQPGGMAKLKASLPFMGTVAVSALMSGVLGTVGLAEYEAIALLFNYLATKSGSDWRMPTIHEWILKGDNSFSNEVLRSGLISASTKAIDSEGYDIGSVNRWQTIIDAQAQGEQAWYSIFPGIKFAVDQAGYLGTIVEATHKDVKTNDFREAVLGSVFSSPTAWARTLWDINAFDANTRLAEPDKAGNDLRPQTKSEMVAQALGTKTLTKKVDQERAMYQKQKETAENEFRSKQKEIFVDAIMEKDLAKADRALNKLIKARAYPQEILNNLQNELWGRTVPQGIRQFVSRSGKMSPAQQRRLLDYIEMYEQNPLIENTQ